jgi:hypothetical protein
MQQLLSLLRRNAGFPSQKASTGLESIKVGLAVKRRCAAPPRQFETRARQSEALHVKLR